MLADRKVWKEWERNDYKKKECTGWEWNVCRIGNELRRLPVKTVVWEMTPCSLMQMY